MVQRVFVDVSFNGMDRHDHHVHAAALAANAQILLTMNERDFPTDDSSPYEVYAPDPFLLLVDDSVPERVSEVVLKQAKYWGNKSVPGRKSLSLAVALQKAGCPEFADRVATHLLRLSGSVR